MTVTPRNGENNDVSVRKEVRLDEPALGEQGLASNVHLNLKDNNKGGKGPAAPSEIQATPEVMNNADSQQP